MAYILIPVIVILMAMTFISLLRGLNAFRHSLDEDTGHEQSTGATELQLKQNRMMWARIKYQLGAIIVVALLLMMAR